MNNAGQQLRTLRVHLHNSSHIRAQDIRATHISASNGRQTRQFLSSQISSKSFLSFREQIFTSRSVVQSAGTRKLLMITQGTIRRHELTSWILQGLWRPVLWSTASTQQTNGSACNLSSSNKSAPSCEFFQAFAAMQWRLHSSGTRRLVAQERRAS